MKALDDDSRTGYNTDVSSVQGEIALSVLSTEEIVLRYGSLGSGLESVLVCARLTVKKCPIILGRVQLF